jgi:hypothetical protein
MPSAFARSVVRRRMLEIPQPALARILTCQAGAKEMMPRAVQGRIVTIRLGSLPSRAEHQRLESIAASRQAGHDP